MKKLYFLIILLIFSNGLLYSQVGVNTDGTSAHNTAMLDVKSENSGFLPPRMTMAQRDAITSPAEGLLVFCTDCDYNSSGAVSVYINSRWRLIADTTKQYPWSCGSSFTINHVASGGVAPVDKAVTYSTVSGIPGEPSKCWITSNLGADHQATAVNDATEASAGWYWQFNLLQGFKHDGTTRTPNTAWIGDNPQNSDWIPANDPCAHELGSGWRIPTYTEWNNVDANTGGNWDTWTDAWNSDLKLHGAGYLMYYDGSLHFRGAHGYYWSSTQFNNGGALYLDFYSTFCNPGGIGKVFGLSVRCLNNQPVMASVTTTNITDITINSAVGGGNVTSEGGATVTARGVCWGTSSNPVFTGSHSTDGSGPGAFTSNLSGLTDNTQYFVRAYATNSVGTSYGNQVTFNTLLNLTLPTVTTTAPTNITSTTVTSGGNITSDGGASVTARGVCWSLSPNPTIADNITTDSSGTGVFVSNLSGLSPNTPYYSKAYATNSIGTAYGVQVSFTTLAGGFTCGSSLPVNHLASGGVAPVDKTVTYGTVTNIPGEPSKCWITSNLGASQQASAKDDATEASAGWYWQFNRQQGYKHDGTTRTPNSSWVSFWMESFDWQAASDPCALELGSGWRIPTKTEWENVDISGSWNDLNGPWNSGLKMHAAGTLFNTDGSLINRGVYGYYWSSTQAGPPGAFYLYITNAECMMYGYYKSNGFTLRCIKE